MISVVRDIYRCVLTFYGHFMDIKFDCSPNEVENLVSSMLGQKLKTKQTTGDGVKVSKVHYAFMYTFIDMYCGFVAKGFTDDIINMSKY